MPKKYAKMGFKKGWAAYRKTTAGRRKTTKSRAKSTRSPPRRRNYNMARKKGYRRSRKEKIPLATVGGLFLTGKSIYDYYKFTSARTDLTDEQKMNAYVAKLIGYNANSGEMEWNALISTWGPAIGGKLISDYVGGPKGLNVNRSIRAIPMFKL